MRLVPAQHVHFSTRALILGHHKTDMQIYQPIFQLFLKLNIPVHNLLFELYTVLFLYKIYLQFCFKMCAHFVSTLLYLSKNSIFHSYISKELTNRKGIYM